MDAYLALAVGASLVSNVAGLGVRHADLLKLALSGDEGAVRRLAKLSLSDEFIAGLADAVCRDPRRLSAELNTLLGLRDFLGPGPAIEVDLIRTESPLTGISVEVIKRCIADRGEWGARVGGVYAVRLFRDVHEGLNELVDKVGRRIAQYGGMGYATYVGITGGTKLEAVVMALAAWLLGAQPIYAGEDGRLVLLPRLPLRLSDDAVAALRALSEGLQPAGLDLRRLEEAGLVYRDSAGRYRVRDWVKPLIPRG